MTERLHRKDYGNLEIRISIDDPAAYTKPWNAVEVYISCSTRTFSNTSVSKNEKDQPHMPPPK